MKFIPRIYLVTPLPRASRGRAVGSEGAFHTGCSDFSVPVNPHPQPQQRCGMRLGKPKDRSTLFRRQCLSRGFVNRTAFSLLELMIVLTIMVGVAAVAWPSLRRPMADSSVQQAANQLRAEISDCRQSASVQGQPRLMRFEANQPVIGWGDWKDLVAEQLADANTLNQEEDTSDLNSWELPVDIVVDEVQLDSRTYVARDESSTLPASTLPASILPNAIEISVSKWYLPFLPNGQTRDAVIVLRDSVTGSRVALQVDGVTGMMKTSRLSAVDPEASE